VTRSLLVIHTQNKEMSQENDSAASGTYIRQLLLPRQPLLILSISIIWYILGVYFNSQAFIAPTSFRPFS
jgi:hypothetical protein